MYFFFSTKVCSLCDYATGYVGNLQKHMRSVHKIDAWQLKQLTAAVAAGSAVSTTTGTVGSGISTMPSTHHHSTSQPLPTTLQSHSGHHPTTSLIHHPNAGHNLTM